MATKHVTLHLSLELYARLYHAAQEHQQSTHREMISRLAASFEGAHASPAPTSAPIADADSRLSDRMAIGQLVRGRLGNPHPRFCGVYGSGGGAWRAAWRSLRGAVNLGLFAMPIDAARAHDAYLRERVVEAGDLETAFRSGYFNTRSYFNFPVGDEVAANARAQRYRYDPSTHTMIVTEQRAEGLPDFLGRMPGEPGYQGRSDRAAITNTGPAPDFLGRMPDEPGYAGPIPGWETVAPVGDDEE